MDDIWKICLDEARVSYQQMDVPVGAVLVKDNNIIAIAHNTREKEHSIIGHAEINAILTASKQLQRWNLSDCELYVTLKPCSMCAEVIKQARIAHVYYILDKLDFKKEYSKTIIEKGKISPKTEQMYSILLSSFFKEKR